MKTELSKIAQELEQGTITENEARNLLLGLLGVSGSFSDWYNNGFKDGLNHRTLKCRCGKN